MIKLSDELYIPTMREILAAPRRRHQRHYAAARITRTNRDWITQTDSPNGVLISDLRALRARAREMARNAPHFRKFLAMAKTNVIGHNGIRLQSRAEFGSGRPNTKLNNLIENAFWEWSYPETCSVSGKLSWVSAQMLFIETLIRDGEVLVEHVDVDPRRNPFGYSLKFWNVDYLDESFNATLSNGNRVIMSVEVDEHFRPQAYYLTTPPGEYARTPEKLRLFRERIPASRMTHAFLLIDDESQARGVTWFHAALLQAKDLHEYTSGVVQQARVAAHTLGFLERSSADEVGFTGADDEAGNPQDIYIDVAPLSMNELPPGYRLSQFDPKQPSQNHAEFRNAMLLDIAASLGVMGFSLSGDMSQVNYSSARVGLGEERDIWRMLQQFVAERFCREVYHRWLDAALLVGRLELNASQYAQVRNPLWRARGWRYVDPQKEIAANIDALNANLATYTDILADQGIDLEEFLATKAAEKLLFERYGVDYNALSAGDAQPPATDQPQDAPAEPAAVQNSIHLNGHKR